jgi:prepilin-type processing-associated H-X9-DG protein
MHSAKMKSRLGLNLVEVMVVVAIVVILVALFMVYREKAFMSTRNIECVSNLRHVGNAFINYANDHDLRLPRRTIAATPTSPASNWVFLMTGFLDNGPDYIGAKVGPNLVTLSRKERFGYHSPLLCTQNSINAGSPQNGTATTYAMNNNCSELWLAQVQEPSRLALLLEGLPDGQSWPVSLPEGSPRVGTKIHSNHGNVVFLDGHVEPISEIPEATSSFWVPFGND